MTDVPIPDSERTAVLGAEQELSLLETIILNTADLSDLAKESALRRLARIRTVIEVARSRYGMALDRAVRK